MLNKENFLQVLVNKDQVIVFSTIAEATHNIKYIDKLLKEGNEKLAIKLLTENTLILPKTRTSNMVLDKAQSSKAKIAKSAVLQIKQINPEWKKRLNEAIIIILQTLNEMKKNKITKGWANSALFVEIGDLLDKCLEILKHSKNQELRQAMLSNMIWPIIKMHPAFLEVYLKSALNQEKYKEIIDGVDVIIIFSKSNDLFEIMFAGSEKIIQGFKELRHFILKYVIDAYNGSNQLQQAYEFYCKYLKNETTEIKSKYPIFLKKAILSILKNQDSTEYAELYKVFYTNKEESIILPSSIINSLALEGRLKINFELHTTQYMAILWVMDMYEKRDDIRGYNFLREHVLNFNFYNIELYNMAVIYELLSLSNMRFQNRLPMPITDEELLNKFEDWFSLDSSVQSLSELIYQFLTEIVYALSDTHLSRVSNFLQKIEQHTEKSKKPFSTYFKMCRLTSHDFIKCDVADEVITYFNAFQNMEVPQKYKAAITSNAIRYLIAKSDQSPNNKQYYLTRAIDLCKSLIKKELFRDQVLYSMGLVYLKLNQPILADEAFSSLIKKYPQYEFDLPYNDDNREDIEEIKNVEMLENTEVVNIPEIKEEEQEKGKEKEDAREESEVPAKKSFKRWRDVISEKQYGKYDIKKVDAYFKQNAKELRTGIKDRDNSVCTYVISPGVTVSSNDKNLVFPLIEEGIVRINIMLNRKELSKYLTPKQLQMVEDLLKDEARCRFARDEKQDGIKSYERKIISIKVHGLGDLRCIAYCKHNIKPQEKNGVELVVIDRVVDHKELEKAIVNYNSSKIQIRKI